MRLILGIFACLIQAGAVHAADIERRCFSFSAGCVIAFTGEIEKGDAERLTQVLLEPLPFGKSHIASLEVDSLGGDVVEALRIGELVRQNMLGVSLARSTKSSAETNDTEIRTLSHDLNRKDRVCASACVLILMSAPARSVSDARVGLHRPRLSAEFYRKQSPSSIARAHADLDRRVRETVIAGGMSTELIDRMMRYASNELLWLNSSDLASLDSEAPWYQEMQIAVCGANRRMERRSAGAFANWDKEGLAEAAAEAGKLSAGSQSCGAGIAMRQQAKFRAAAQPQQLSAAQKSGARPAGVNRPRSSPEVRTSAAR